MVIAFAVVELESGEICGFSQLDMQNENCPQFGIDIIDAYMGKGYGYRASALVRKYASDWENVEYFTWKADSDNEKSRRIAEKLGGVLIQQRHFLPDKVIEFGLERGILEEEDLSIVCKYKIEKV